MTIPIAELRSGLRASKRNQITTGCFDECRAGRLSSGSIQHDRLPASGTGGCGWRIRPRSHRISVPNSREPHNAHEIDALAARLGNMTRGINTGAIRIEQQRRHHHGIERWLSPAAWRKADWDNTTGRSPSRQLVGEVYLRTLDRHPLMPISGLITFTRLAAVPPAPFGGNPSLDPATVGAHFLPPRYSAVENVRTCVSLQFRPTIAIYQQ